MNWEMMKKEELLEPKIIGTVQLDKAFTQIARY